MDPATNVYFHLLPAEPHPRHRGIDEIVRELYNDPASPTAALFRRYNAPLASNGSFHPGQALFVPTSESACLAHDAAIVESIGRLKGMHARLQRGDQQTLAERYAIISLLEEHGTAGLGAGSAMLSNRIKFINATMDQIERSYVSSYQQHGHMHNQGFLQTRRRLFRQLDHGLGSLIRAIAFEAKGSGKIKNQLGISTKSQILEWNRAGSAEGGLKTFPDHYARLNNLASKLRGGGYALLALDAMITAKNIHAACAVPDPGDPLHCKRTQYREVGRFAGSASAGAFAAGTAYGACNIVFGAPSMGTSLLWCAVIAGGVSSVGAGMIGGDIGEGIGNFAFENVYSQR